MFIRLNNKKKNDDSALTNNFQFFSILNYLTRLVFTYKITKRFSFAQTENSQFFLCSLMKLPTCVMVSYALLKQS